MLTVTVESQLTYFYTHPLLRKAEKHTRILKQRVTHADLAALHMGTARCHSARRTCTHARHVFVTPNNWEKSRREGVEPPFVERASFAHTFFRRDAFRSA